VNRENLFQVSINRIKESQSKWGSFVASPTFPTYAFCWYRDSAFIAYALSLTGEFESAERFHNWAAATLLENEMLIESALRLSPENALSKGLYINARYQMDGSSEPHDEENDSWPNFQLDGLGTWIWSLEQQSLLSRKSPSDEMIRAVDLASRYLIHMWRLPCFDYWEENPDEVHASTIISIRSGLISAEVLLGENFYEVIAEIDALLESSIIKDGIATKSSTRNDLDSSSLGFIIPFGAAPSSAFDPERQLSGIVSELGKSGGFQRYASDTYYGGGAWILLTAWGAWAAISLGRFDLAEELLVWIEEKADSAGNLPEQISDPDQNAEYLKEWNDRWGKSANPLTWSHAMYVIAVHALNGLERN